MSNRNYASTTRNPTRTPVPRLARTRSAPRIPNLARRWATVTLGMGLGIATAATSTAQPGTCGPQYYAWSPPSAITTNGLASAPALDPGDTLYYPKGNPITYLAQGSTLFSVRRFADGGQPGGTFRWTWQASPPTPLPSSPNPVRSRGREFVFLAGENGFLYKINAIDGTTSLMFDTRRMINGIPLCGIPPGDGILSTPAVQLYDQSNSAFQSAADAAGHCGDDLVFVATANGCGDMTRNRVFARWASDLTGKWTFNADFARKVDSSIGGCVVDYSTNTVYFATNLDDAATGQNSLFALDAITGALKWSTNAGAVLNRPMLNGGRLYIARKSGSVMAYDPAGSGLGGGAPLWASSLAVASLGTQIIQNIVTFGSRLLIVDTDGVMHAVQDTGSAGVKLWVAAPEPGVRFTSAPAVLQLAGGTYAAFIGRDDGTVQQVDLGLASPTFRGTIVSGEFFDVVCTPTIDLEPGEPSQQRLVVAATSGTVTRLKLPLCNSAPFGPASRGEK